MKEIKNDDFTMFIQLCMDEGMHRIFDSHLEFFETCFQIFDEKEKNENYSN